MDLKLFASCISEAPNDRKSQHEISYRLLSYAAREMWGDFEFSVSKTEKGKPFFTGYSTRHFSLSHTKTHAFVGVSNSQIGVDIEKVRKVKDGLAERLFSPHELENFGFFGGWTARESLYKLTGKTGLRDTRLFADDGLVLCDVEGACCRIYSGISGCVAAVSCFDCDFAERIILIDEQTLITQENPAFND